jgi:hypothetical protein
MSRVSSCLGFRDRIGKGGRGAMGGGRESPWIAEGRRREMGNRGVMGLWERGEGQRNMGRRDELLQGVQRRCTWVRGAEEEGFRGRRSGTHRRRRCPVAVDASFSRLWFCPPFLLRVGKGMRRAAIFWPRPSVGAPKWWRGRAGASRNSFIFVFSARERCQEAGPFDWNEKIAKHRHIWGCVKKPSTRTTFQFFL